MSTTQQPEALRDARWYMVNRDGMATLCTDRQDAEKEAEDAQSVWPHMGPHRAVQLVEAASVASNAEREPIAWLVCTEEGDPDMVFLSQHEAQQYLEDDERPTPLYTHPSPPEGMATPQADSVLEDAALLKEARDALWQPANVALCERIDDYLDAARKQGENHD